MKYYCLDLGATDKEDNNRFKSKTNMLLVEIFKRCCGQYQNTEYY